MDVTAIDVMTAAVPAANGPDRAAALLARLGPDLVTLGPDVPARNHRDWSSLPVAPVALLRPRTTEDVSKAMGACSALALAVVPQGGLTGLCGGATPSPGSVALSLERMVGVEQVDTVGRTLTALAGTPLLTAQAAAQAAGLLLPLDLGARGSCAVGGVVATNAGGNRVVRYGMTRDLVAGLEVVLPDGTVLDGLSPLMKNNTGYDWKQLFIGAEGTLGVVTRVMFRLVAEPASVQAAVCGLTSFEAALAVLDRAHRQLGGQLSAFEAMWPPFLELMATKAVGVRRPLAGRHALYLLVEAHGADAAGDGARFEAWLAGLLDDGLIQDAALAQSRADAAGFWALRDAVAEFATILGPHTGFDVSLPTAELGAFAAEAEAALERRFPGRTCLVFGHLGDGNLHLVVHVPGAGPQPAAEVAAVIYDLVRARHGSISAEHGIGTARAAYLGHSRSPAEIAFMRSIKAAIDPRQLMNPGKVLMLS